jgi:hypothetical protein
MFVIEQKAVVSIIIHTNIICAALAMLEVQGKQVFLLFFHHLLFSGIRI